MKHKNKARSNKVSEKQPENIKSFKEEETAQSLKDSKAGSLSFKKQDEGKDKSIKLLGEKLKQAESDNLYLRAEFENFKKRTLEEKFSILRYEGEKFISCLATEVLDDLDRALLASKENKSLEDLQKGLEMIHKKANKLLSRFGVAVLDPTGKAFDPSYQEALNFMTSSKVPEDFVVETYKKAYKLHDKVIRPAQVVVAKKK